MQVLGQMGRRRDGSGRAVGAVEVQAAFAATQQGALRAAGPEGIGDATRHLGGAGHEFVELAVIRPSLALRGPRRRVEHPFAHPLRHQLLQPVTERRQCVELLGVALFDQGASGHGQRAEPGGRHLDAKTRGHHLLELVCLVEDHGVVIGQHGTPTRQMGAVEMGVDDDDVSQRRPFPRSLRRSSGRRRGS